LKMPGTLRVRIISGRGFPVMDRSNETTDAFVEVKFGQSVHRTEIYPKSLNPKWDTDWFCFEAEEENLQDECLQIRVMDYDTYSANDSIGRVYVDLTPLLHAKKREISGWFPIYDTMNASAIPVGQALINIHGFVDELITSSDPEYEWIDKIRTPRASNEVRQTLFSKIAGELTRRIGKKAAEMGGNAIIGYSQYFDFEGELGIVIRGNGTVVTLEKCTACSTSLIKEKRERTRRSARLVARIEILPFIEHEAHSQVISQTSASGKNAVFGIQRQFSIGEEMVVLIVTGTAVFLPALASPKQKADCSLRHPFKTHSSYPIVCTFCDMSKFPNIAKRAPYFHNTFTRIVRFNIHENELDENFLSNKLNWIAKVSGPIRARDATIQDSKFFRVRFSKIATSETAAASCSSSSSGRWSNQSKLPWQSACEELEKAPVPYPMTVPETFITALLEPPLCMPITSYLGYYDFFFIRETTAVRDIGGLEAFVQIALAEILHVVQAHVTAFGGQGMVSFKFSVTELSYGLSRNQVQFLIGISDNPLPFKILKVEAKLPNGSISYPVNISTPIYVHVQLNNTLNRPVNKILSDMSLKDIDECQNCPLSTGLLELQIAYDFTKVQCIMPFIQTGNEYEMDFSKMNVFWNENTKPNHCGNENGFSMNVNDFLNANDFDYGNGWANADGIVDLPNCVL
ncbi:C2 domain-containing protein 5, partial [Trichinella sp. T9]